MDDSEMERNVIMTKMYEVTGPFRGK
jgi:hypothetical protein